MHNTHRLGHKRPRGSVPAGFRALSGTFASVGLIATATTTSNLIFSPVNFYSASAVTFSGVFAVVNLWFVFARKPRRWMAYFQSAILAILGLMMAVLSDPDVASGPLVYALAVALLVIQGGVSRLRVFVVALVAGLVIDVVASVLIFPESIRHIAATATISIGVFAVVVFGIGLEVMRLRIIAAGASHRPHEGTPSDQATPPGDTRNTK